MRTPVGLAKVVGRRIYAEGVMGENRPGHDRYNKLAIESVLRSITYARESRQQVEIRYQQA